MADQLSDFLQQSRTLAQQSWETWMRQLQGAAPVPVAASGPWGHWTPPGASAWPPAAGGLGGLGGGDAAAAMQRGLAGIKSYMDWIQQSALGQGAAPADDWQAQLQQMFAGVQQPFANPFQGMDGAMAQDFVKQWQSWVEQAGQHLPFQPGEAKMPAFGLQREQIGQQQALVAATMQSLEQQRRYQALLMRAHALGLERLQARLADRTEPGRQIDSWKALYDLWVDSAEEAYAEIALSDEFGEVYGAMVNAQMHERSLRQQAMERVCRQLGLPTRSEVDSLGRRLQEVRRQQRSTASADAEVSGEVAELRSEVADLKRQLAESNACASAPAPAKPAAASPAPAKPVAVKKVAKRKSSAKAKSRGSAPAKSAARKSKSASGPRARKR